MFCSHSYHEIYSSYLVSSSYHFYHLPVYDYVPRLLMSYHYYVLILASPAVLSRYVYVVLVGYCSYHRLRRLYCSYHCFRRLYWFDFFFSLFFFPPPRESVFFFRPWAISFLFYDEPSAQSLRRHIAYTSLLLPRVLNFNKYPFYHSFCCPCLLTVPHCSLSRPDLAAYCVY